MHKKEATTETNQGGVRRTRIYFPVEEKTNNTVFFVGQGEVEEGVPQ